jgi:hypothetical protein
MDSSRLKASVHGDVSHLALHLLLLRVILHPLLRQCGDNAGDHAVRPESQGRTPLFVRLGAPLLKNQSLVASKN